MQKQLYWDGHVRCKVGQSCNKNSAIHGGRGCEAQRKTNIIESQKNESFQGAIFFYALETPMSSLKNKPVLPLARV